MPYRLFEPAGHPEKLLFEFPVSAAVLPDLLQVHGGVLSPTRRRSRDTRPHIPARRARWTHARAGHAHRLHRLDLSRPDEAINLGTESPVGVEAGCRLAPQLTVPQGDT